MVLQKILLLIMLEFSLIFISTFSLYTAFHEKAEGFDRVFMITAGVMGIIVGIIGAVGILLWT